MRNKQRFNKWIVQYVVETKFEPIELYEATDVANWLGVPLKHRLMRYYLNRLTREGVLVKIVWGHRTFYGLRSIAYVFEMFDEMFERYTAGVYKVRKRWTSCPIRLIGK